VADIAFYSLGADYLRRYRALIRALTPEQLTDALRRHVDPEQLAVAVARPA
jgi:predicted Zn-dependent peptidase